MFLTCSLSGLYSFHLIPAKGAYPGTLWNVGVGTAPAGVGVVPRALGRPWVTVRPHYGGLPSMAGRDRRRAGNRLETCARKHGPGDRNRRGGAPGGVAVCLYSSAIRGTSRGRYTTRCVCRRSVSPQRGRIKTKAKLARWREDEAAWLFEI